LGLGVFRARDECPALGCGLLVLVLVVAEREHDLRRMLSLVPIVVLVRMAVLVLVLGEADHLVPIGSSGPVLLLGAQNVTDEHGPVAARLAIKCDGALDQA
jgi:hypothetical protein